jgi:hypothetical protein
MEPRQQLRHATTAAACGSEPNEVLKCGVAAVARHGTLWSSSKRPLSPSRQEGFGDEDFYAEKVSEMKTYACVEKIPKTKTSEMKTRALRPAPPRKPINHVIDAAKGVEAQR